MKLLDNYLKNELNTYLINNIRFEPIGDIRVFSDSLQKTIHMVEEKTAHCDGLVHSLALNYGSHNEIIRAVNKLRNLKEDITIQMLSNTLDCKHDVDLLIRSGGDKRLSNFLLWQVAYAELFFIDTLWPDFSVKELEKIIKKFKKVERRFGGLK
jgi:undecaprenyl diphosphate synthase